MSVLIETSVWVAHFRQRNATLLDLVLLASTRITPGARLWTLDKRLADLAQRFGVAYQTPVH